jgi:hypothetical protein
MYEGYEPWLLTFVGKAFFLIVKQLAHIFRYS